MDIFIHNLKPEVTDQQLRKFFLKPLEEFDIYNFELSKLRGKGFAIITIRDPIRGARFLAKYGQKGGFQPRRQSTFTTPSANQLVFHKQPVYCKRSNKPCDTYVVASLGKQEQDRLAREQRKVKTAAPKGINIIDQGQERAFDIKKTRIGHWHYAEDDLKFACHLIDERKGRILFGQRGLMIKLRPLPGPDEALQQLEIPYDSIVSLITWAQPGCIILSLSEPPRIYEEVDSSVTDLLKGLLFSQHVRSFRRRRLHQLNEAHGKVVGHCLAYRLSLADGRDARLIESLTKRPDLPDSMRLNVSVRTNPAWASESSRLNYLLAQSRMPYEVSFQLQRLADNGYFMPSLVEDMIPKIKQRLLKDDAVTVASAIRHMASMTPEPGPGIQAHEFSLETVMDEFKRSQAHVYEHDPYSTRIAEEHDHMTMIHKAHVTPTRTLLHGPAPEMKNRVLRKYAAYTDHFISVSFVEENGNSLRFDRQTDISEIWARFHRVLDSPITIAGRPFQVCHSPLRYTTAHIRQFLGFSHSSLREATCWFMAPFNTQDVPIYAPGVIKDLGDFSAIQVPAKCAARIGQAFSQTLSAIEIPDSAVTEIADVEHNGRTFSDGCGTLSEEAMHKIWSGYREVQRLALKPTIFQVRYKGKCRPYFRHEECPY